MSRKTVLVMILAISGSMATLLAQARVPVGGGMYCNRTAGYVDGAFSGWEYTDCVYDPGAGGAPDDGGNPPLSPMCMQIQLSRPPDCENRITKPNSGEYGAPKYQLTSGLGRALGLMTVLKPFRTIDPDYPAKIDNILASHTRAIATLTSEKYDVDLNLLNGIKGICSDLSRRTEVMRQNSPFPIDSPSEQERACYNTEIQIAREMSSSSTMQMILNALTITGLNLSEFIPHSLIALIDPDNSLNTKWNLVMKDAKCAVWWNQLDSFGCMAQ